MNWITVSGGTMIRALIASIAIALCPIAAQAEGLDEVTVADPLSRFEQLLHRAGFADLQKSYALVVGVSDFDQFSDLPTENDPARVRDYLINEAGFDYVHILTEENVTKARLEELMVDVFRPLVGPSDRFLFYWSGHGETLEVGGGQLGFLPLAQSNKEAFSTMVAMSDLTRWNRYIEAHQVLYLLDSCFSGLAGGAPQSDLAEITREQLAGPGRHMITAGRINEQTIAVDELGGSIFTHALLKGLRGAADARNMLGADGLITVGELKSYIGQEVGRLRGVYNWQKTITPQIRDLSGSDGAFFFPLPASFLPDDISDTGSGSGAVIPQGSDPDILQIQQSLTELGYDPGPIDGRLGFATRLALSTFQTDNGLGRTGEVDDATVIAILQALAPAISSDETDTENQDEPQQTGSMTVVDEMEPNDGIRDAQSLSVGQIIAGRFKDQSGDIDWYSVSFDSENVAEHEVKLRHVNGNNVRAIIYDRREQEIGDLSTRSGVAYFSLQNQNSSTIFIKITGAVGGWDTDTYEISIERR